MGDPLTSFIFWFFFFIYLFIFYLGLINSYFSIFISNCVVGLEFYHWLKVVSVFFPFNRYLNKFIEMGNDFVLKSCGDGASVKYCVREIIRKRSRLKEIIRFVVLV